MPTFSQGFLYSMMPASLAGEKAAFWTFAVFDLQQRVRKTACFCVDKDAYVQLLEKISTSSSPYHKTRMAHFEWMRRLSPPSGVQFRQEHLLLGCRWRWNANFLLLACR